jgi:hypothetical protein
MVEEPKPAIAPITSEIKATRKNNNDDTESSAYIISPPPMTD